MMNVTLTRDSLSRPWGFRLRGGFDQGLPVKVQRIFSGSPAEGVLKRGDTVEIMDGQTVEDKSNHEIMDILRVSGLQLGLRFNRTEDGGDGPVVASGYQPLQLQQQAERPVRSSVPHRQIWRSKYAQNGHQDQDELMDGLTEEEYDAMKQSISERRKIFDKPDHSSHSLPRKFGSSVQHRSTHSGVTWRLPEQQSNANFATVPQTDFGWAPSAEVLRRARANVPVNASSKPQWSGRPVQSSATTSKSLDRHTSQRWNRYEPLQDHENSRKTAVHHMVPQNNQIAQQYQSNVHSRLNRSLSVNNFRTSFITFTNQHSQQPAPQPVIGGEDRVTTTYHGTAQNPITVHRTHARSYSSSCFEPPSRWHDSNQPSIPAATDCLEINLYDSEDNRAGNAMPFGVPPSQHSHSQHAQIHPAYPLNHSHMARQRSVPPGEESATVRYVPALNDYDHHRLNQARPVDYNHSQVFRVVKTEQPSTASEWRPVYQPSGSITDLGETSSNYRAAVPLAQRKIHLAPSYVGPGPTSDTHNRIIQMDHHQQNHHQRPTARQQPHQQHFPGSSYAQTFGHRYGMTRPVAQKSVSSAVINPTSQPSPRSQMNNYGMAPSHARAAQIESVPYQHQQFPAASSSSTTSPGRARRIQKPTQAAPPLAFSRDVYAGGGARKQPNVQVRQPSLDFTNGGTDF